MGKLNAVGGSLLCFIAATSATAGIGCTQSDFQAALQAACAGGSKVITFDSTCRGAVIPIAPGTRSLRELTCDGVIIDGQDLNVTFQMTPAWWDNGQHCDANGDGAFSEDCDPDGDGTPNYCPEWESGDWFLVVRGNNTTVTNLTIRYFYDGIHFDDGTHGNTIHAVRFENQADDSFTNEEGAWGNTFSNNTLVNQCDKGIQLYGRDRTTSSGYDVEILENTFTNVDQPIRATHSGRFLVRDNVIREVNAPTLFKCEGPRFDGTKIALYWRGNTLEGCNRGLRVSGDVHLIVSEGNIFQSNRLRGLFLYDNANGSPRAMVQDSVFLGNGGSTSSEGGYGGVAVKGGAILDLGGGSQVLDGQTQGSHGGNVLRGNKSATDSTVDVENTSSSAVRAESNWWGDLDPADQVVGTVDFSPWLLAAPQVEEGPTPPGNLRRSDVKP